MSRFSSIHGRFGRVTAKTTSEEGTALDEADQERPRVGKRTVLDMAGAKNEGIRIVDRSTIKELGDRFEIEWRLSARPELEWAEIFQLAEVSERQGPPEWVGGGGPDVMDAVVRWFVPGEEVENADAEVRYRLSVANQRFGTGQEPESARTKSREIECFFNDENGYEQWLRSKAVGYVLNCEPNPKPSYLVLHRASCRTISGTPSKGSTWTTAYMKVCADSVSAIDEWASSHTGQLPHRCNVCQP